MIFESTDDLFEKSLSLGRGAMPTEGIVSIMIAAVVVVFAVSGTSSERRAARLLGSLEELILHLRKRSEALGEVAKRK